METQEYSIFPDRPTQYAGFWPRFAACLIDVIICGVVSRLLNLLINLEGSYSGIATGYLINLVWQWLYFALQEASVHQATIGKRALGIRVTDMDGIRVSFARASGRYWAKQLSALTLLIGYLWMLWDDRKQTLHDKLANTLVLKA